jgi:hypothetical protein
MVQEERWWRSWCKVLLRAAGGNGTDNTGGGGGGGSLLIMITVVELVEGVVIVRMADRRLFRHNNRFVQQLHGDGS